MLDSSELLNLNQYVKLLISLLAISDPLGVIPIYLSLVRNHTATGKKRIASVAVIAYALTLLIFCYSGQSILDVFGITISSFQVGGGILLLINGLEMINFDENVSLSQDMPSSQSISVGIVPLAIPLLAGSGAITTIIIFASNHDSPAHKLLVSGVIVMVALIIYLVFWMIVRMNHIFGNTTITVINRIMGLITISIAIEFIFGGIVGYFPGLTTIHDKGHSMLVANKIMH